MADRCQGILSSPGDYHAFFRFFRRHAPFIDFFLFVPVAQGGRGGTVGSYLFSWAALGYSFKFVWAPLVDQMPIPWLTRKLGRRRSWILAAQTGIAAAIVWMACTDPAAGQHPWFSWPWPP